MIFSQEHLWHFPQKQSFFAETKRVFMVEGPRNNQEEQRNINERSSQAGEEIKIHAELFNQKGTGENAKTKETYKLTDYVSGSGECSDDDEGGEQIQKKYEQAFFLINQEEFLDNYIEYKNLEKRKEAEAESFADQELLDANRALMEKQLGKERLRGLNQQIQNKIGEEPLDRDGAKQILKDDFEEHSELFKNNIQSFVDTEYSGLEKEVEGLLESHMQSLKVAELEVALDELGTKKAGLLMQLDSLTQAEILQQDIGIDSEDFKESFKKKRKNKKAYFKVRETKENFAKEYGKQEGLKDPEGNFVAKPYNQWSEEQKDRYSAEHERIIKEYQNGPEPVWEESDRETETALRFSAWFETSNEKYQRNLKNLKTELLNFTKQIQALKNRSKHLKEKLEGEPDFHKILEAAEKNIQKNNLNPLPFALGIAAGDHLNDIRERFEGTSSDEAKAEIQNELRYSKDFYDTLGEIQEHFTKKPQLKKEVGEITENFQKATKEEERQKILTGLQKLQIIEDVDRDIKFPTDGYFKKEFEKSMDQLFDTNGPYAQFLPEDFRIQKEEIKEDVKACAKDIKEKLNGLSDEEKEAHNEIMNEAQTIDEKAPTLEKLETKYKTAIGLAEGLMENADVPDNLREKVQNLHSKLLNDKEKIKSKIQELEDSDLPNKEQNKKKRLKDADSELSPELAFLDKVQNKAIQAGGIQGTQWSFVSILGAIKGFQHFFEYIDERVKHNVEIEGTITGSAFGKSLEKVIPHRNVKAFAMRERSKQEKLDAEERNRWEGMEDLDALTLVEQNILNPADEHHWRKSMEIAAEKGLVRWEDPRLQDTIYKLAKKINPRTQKWTKSERQNDMTRDDKLRNLCYTVTNDENWYDDTKNKNQGSIKSEQDKFKTQFEHLDKLSGQKGKLAQMLILQEEFANGQGKPEYQLNNYGQIKQDGYPTYLNKEINPHYYAEIILESVKNGMMPRVEDKLFFLIRGIATGLLNFSILDNLPEIQNNFPAFAAISQFSFEEILEADKHLTGSYGEDGNFHSMSNTEEREKNFFHGDPSFINNWIYNHLKKHPSYVDRIGKVDENSIQGIDHDDTYMFLPDLSLSNAQKFTKGQSTKSLMNPQKWMGTMTGFTANLQNIKVDANDNRGIKKMSEMLTVHLQFDSMVSRRLNMDKHQPSIASEYQNNQLSNQGGDFGMMDHSKIIRNFMASFLEAVGKTDDIHMVFYDTNQENKEQKEPAIKKMTEKTFPRAVAENKEFFAFFLKKWQEGQVFGNHYISKYTTDENGDQIVNKKTTRAIADNYQGISNELKGVTLMQEFHAQNGGLQKAPTANSVDIEGGAAANDYQQKLAA